MRLSSVPLFASLGLSLLACRGGDKPGTDVDAPTTGDDVTIQMIQDPAMKVGTAVTVKGVVVTAIDKFGARTGDVWVEEPGGGEFSGIKLFGVPIDTVATLEPGDLVDITNAEKDEFALMADMSGNKVTELKGVGGGMLTLTKVGAGTVPAPVMVDALAIDMKATQAERDAEWEKYEGVLIKVINARQTSDLKGFGTSGAEDAKGFNATGRVEVQTLLTGFGANAVVGTCYESITGIGDYFFSYKLLPRSAADLVDGGTGCAAQTAASITDIQGGTVTGDVVLENVFVTARDDIGGTKGLWVQDTLQGAANNGVFVFTGNTLDAAFAVGVKVTVRGLVDEFDPNGMGDKVTEIKNATVTVVDATAGVPLPLTATAADAGDIVNGEPFEGVLVSVSTIKVTNNALGNGKVEFTANGGAKIVLDDDLVNAGTFTLNNGDCKNVVGVMHVQLTDDVRTLLPRGTADITAGAGCN